MKTQDYVLIALLIGSMFLFSLPEKSQKKLLISLGVSFITFVVVSLLYGCITR